MMRKMEAEFHPALMNMAASLRSIPAPNTCEADRGLADFSPPTTEPGRLIQWTIDRVLSSATP